MSLKLYQNAENDDSPRGEGIVADLVIPFPSPSAARDAEAVGPTRGDCIGYMIDLIAELEGMSSQAGLPRLSWMLALAHSQALEDRAALEPSGATPRP